MYINWLQTHATLIYSHGTGQIFDRFKSLTGQVIHTGPLNIWALFTWNFEWLGIELFVWLRWFHVNGTPTCKCRNYLPVEHSSSANSLSGKSVLSWWLCFMGGKGNGVPVYGVLILKSHKLYIYMYLSLLQINSRSRSNAWWNFTIHMQGSNCVSFYGYKHIQWVHSCCWDFSLQGNGCDIFLISIIYFV